VLKYDPAMEAIAVRFYGKIFSEISFSLQIIRNRNILTCNHNTFNLASAAFLSYALGFLFQLVPVNMAFDYLLAVLIRSYRWQRERKVGNS
jgi:hypothetical protein